MNHNDVLYNSLIRLGLLSICSQTINRLENE